MIHAPVKPLRDFQQRLAGELTEDYVVPSHVHGFVPARSPLTNAQVHRGREWVLRVDLADFFPSINFGRVRGLFMSSPFEFGEPAATLLAQICCFEGCLPQGAPTSPIISNYICHSLDRGLASLASSARCSVTRYADDLCFSTDQAYFPHHIAYVHQGVTAAGEAVEEVVQSNGFEINSAKTRLMRRTQRQRVTGLVVNEKANVSRNYVRDLRNLLYIWKRYGEAAAITAWKKRGHPYNWPPGKPAPEFARVVRGRVQHVGSVKGWTNSTYLGLAGILGEVDEGFTLRHEAPPAPPADRLKARLFTEGKTDVTHILAAQRSFHRQGEFLDIELIADEQSAQRGDRRLLRRCEGLSYTPQPMPCICLFDSDNAEVLEEAVGSRDWKDWGNRVAAVAIVDADADRSCIETLYDDSVREIEDHEGRRFFLMSEFDEKSGLHESGRFVAPHPSKNKLVPEHVFEIEGNRSAGLSKADFAAAIEAEAEGFSVVSFDGFRPTFETIRDVLAAIAPASASD